MKNYSVEEIKDFLNELFVNEKYDSFYMYEARVRTALDYYISGRRNMEYYDDIESKEGDSPSEYICWKNIKNSIFELIHGERMPISFKIILMFNRDNVERLIEMNNLPLGAHNVGGLYMNIYYENNELIITTGTSLKIFTLDKAMENIWDDTVGKYYIR